MRRLLRDTRRLQHQLFGCDPYGVRHLDPGKFRLDVDTEADLGSGADCLLHRTHLREDSLVRGLNRPKGSEGSREILLVKHLRPPDAASRGVRCEHPATNRALSARHLALTSRMVRA